MYSMPLQEDKQLIHGLSPKTCALRFENSVLECVYLLLIFSTLFNFSSLWYEINKVTILYLDVKETQV